MLFHSVRLARVPGRVLDQRALPVFQRLDTSQFKFKPLQLGRLPCDVLVETFKRTSDDLQVVQDEVGQVPLVGFCEEESVAVLGWCLKNYVRDRDELGHPIAMASHRPVEQGARRPAVAINERSEERRVGKGRRGWWKTGEARER